MRHFIASCPVTACPFGMRAPSMTGGLVACAGGPLTLPPSEPAAASGAIDLAAVAATANQRLSAATRADEQACRRCVVMARTADDTWTNAAVAPILALHTCPARCGARRRTKLPGLSAAPCLFFAKDKLLPRHRPQRHGEHHRQTKTHHLTEAPTLPQCLPQQRQFARSPDLHGFRPPSTSLVETFNYARQLPLSSNPPYATFLFLSAAQAKYGKFARVARSEARIWPDGIFGGQGANDREPRPPCRCSWP